MVYELVLQNLYGQPEKTLAAILGFPVGKQCSRRWRKAAGWDPLLPPVKAIQWLYKLMLYELVLYDLYGQPEQPPAAILGGPREPGGWQKAADCCIAGQKKDTGMMPVAATQGLTGMSLDDKWLNIAYLVSL